MRRFSTSTLGEVVEGSYRKRRIILSSFSKARTFSLGSGVDVHRQTLTERLHKFAVACKGDCLD